MHPQSFPQPLGTPRRLQLHLCPLDGGNVNNEWWPLAKNTIYLLGPLLLQLLDRGLRELYENGPQLPQGQFSWVPLVLWESAYPPRLSRRVPKYHHIILYLLVVSQESQEQLQARIQPNPSEVDLAFIWLDADVAAAVAATENGTEIPRHPSQDLPPSVL